MLKINNLQRFCSPVLGAKLGFYGLFCVIWGFVALGTGACGNESREADSPKKVPPCADTVLFSPMQYSGMLKLGVSCGVDFAEISSVVGRDTLTRRFALVDSMKFSKHGLDIGRLKLGRGWKNALILQVPLRRVVALSSAHLGYMERLGVTDRIIGVGDAKYIADAALYYEARGERRETRDGRREPIAELGNGLSLNYEKLLALRPDLVMTFATGGSEDDYARLKALGIPVMLTSEWQEVYPLAKMEWIKLYGKLFCNADSTRICEFSSDSIFEQSRKMYEDLASLSGVEQEKKSQDCDYRKPRVLVGMSYGGVWYAPGGRSYTAKLIFDAGGRYLWESDTTREMKLSLEEVMALSDSVDVWINPGAFSTPEELIAADPRVKKIKAFREKMVFQNDGILGPGGANDFYESAVAKPSELLENLAKCLKKSLLMCENAKKQGKNEYLKDTSYKWYKNIFNF